ncbi:hypothetical protein PHMEG_00024072 [Phytophthora megakarya]|uniref:Retrotransposon gag domain-containing protein n=1 Tax=Phytophthora megakarya TaxID=4795 RepID=A0A225VH26_9STRA|nr:hypothetical protein PHMEG_00024072 [Phytophthora megakarya]
MSALALRDAGNMGIKEEQESLLNEVRQQVSESQSPEIPQAEAGHLAQDTLESRFAHYQLRAETHMEAQRRQHLDEMAAFEKEFQTLRLERDQEREANKNLQSFLVGRLKKQAERQAGKPVSSGVNMGVPSVLRKQMVPPEVKTLYATQTQVALRDLDETNVARAATAKAATTTAVKNEATADVRKAPAEGKPRKKRARKPDQGKNEPPKDDSKKKSTPPSQPAGKHGPPDDEPSDDDHDFDKESGDSDSDSSSFEDLASGTQTRATGQGTIMFNPMVYITALEDFDEKQPLAVRTRWLEKLQSLAVMGRWSDHAKVYYCKLKLSSAVRDWRGNLDESVRWKRFAKAFREEYCKAKTPDSEYYYTTFQKTLSDVGRFYYRSNKIDDNADIDIKSTDIARAFGNRQRQKNHSRVYNVNEDEAFASNDEQQLLLDQGVEDSGTKPSNH